jgi:two-component system, OmpR family, sensor kinase
MNLPFQSIRWRLQAWHGLMLLVVLVAFGYTAWHLARDNRLRRVDQELQRRALPLVGMFSGGPPRGPGRFGQRPPGEPRPPVEPREANDPPSERPIDLERGPDRPVPEPRPDTPPPEGSRQRFEGRGGPDGFRFSGGNFQMPPEIQRIFENVDNSEYYHVIWVSEQPDSTAVRELRRATNAPARIPQPAITASLDHGQAWTRGHYREFAQTTRRGNLVLVGHDITPDLAELNQLALLLTAAGGGVLLLGLAGGWWLATRAIAPIADISATAGKIAAGNLAERINTRDTASEFGQLARVLNHTFDRLQAAFARQVQFTADASHELRTPVSVILSQTQTALKRDRPPEEYRETIESCQRSAVRMRQLVESLLMLARLDSGENATRHEPCELDRVAKDAVELLRPLAVEQNVRLESDWKPARCLGDTGQLGQVVTNLVSNAVYYNQPGGEVRVSVTAEDGCAVLRVADTGQGIASEDLAHIFERFYRADKSRSRAQGRTGLGLAITKAIVEAHKGAIEVTSEPGKGSAFTVRLPLLV